MTGTLAILMWEPLTVDDHAMERTIFVRSGFDCRGGCTPECPHKRKLKGFGGNTYGWNGDHYRLAVRFDQGVVVLGFYTAFLKDLVLQYGQEALVAPDFLTVCTAFPRTTEQLIAGYGDACIFQRGSTCYNSTGWELHTDELCGPHAAKIAKLIDPRQSRVEEQLRTEFDGLWRDLGRLLLKRYAEAVADQKALPRRCEHCAGKGVVER